MIGRKRRATTKSKVGKRRATIRKKTAKRACSRANKKECQEARHQLHNNRINGVSGADVVAGPQIVRRRIERQPIKPDNIFPGQLVRETPAHLLV